VVELWTRLWFFLNTLLFQRCVDHGLKTGHVSIPQESAVYKNRGGPSNPDAVSLGQVPVDYRLDPRVFLVLAEFFHIQIEFLGNLSDLLCVQTVVVFEEEIVEFPELPLSLRGKGRNSGLLGKPVVPQRKILEYNFHTFGILFEHLLE
jgi:hypothetical protein